MRNPLGVALLSIVVGVGAVACGGGDGDGAGPIERGLRGLPLAAYDEAHHESGGAVQIEIADIAAISELRNLDAPEPGRDAEDVQDGLFELSVPPRDRVEVDLLGTGEPSLVQTPLGAFDDELGLDVGAITSSASITAPPIVFTVFTGCR